MHRSNAMEFVPIGYGTYKDFADPYGPSTFGKTELILFPSPDNICNYVQVLSGKGKCYFLSVLIVELFVVVAGVTISFISGVDEVEVVIITFISLEPSATAATTGETGTS